MSELTAEEDVVVLIGIIAAGNAVVNEEKEPQCRLRFGWEA